MGWVGSVADADADADADAVTVAAVPGPVSLAVSPSESVFGPSLGELSSGESDFLSALALSLSSFLRFFANSF